MNYYHDRNILSIDIKSFFASAECINRGLDPFKVALVVADKERGDGAMCIAASPYLRSLGVNSRCRLFELPKNIDIIYAKPRMSLYTKVSNDVIDVYKEFVAEEDIHVYSIDEVFIDITDYLNYYRKSDYELAKDIMNRIKEKTGLTTTCGIGPNILLSKVALDLEAKSSKDFIAKWTYKDVESKLWNISPLSELWGIGKNIEKKLNNLGINKIGDINNYSRNFYIKRFGNVAGNEIWCKANGIDFVSVKDRNKKPKEKSFNMSQILYRDYNTTETLLIIKEMVDMLCKRLRDNNKYTRKVYLKIKYSRDLEKDFYDTMRLEHASDNSRELYEVIRYLYEKHVEALPIRKVSISFSSLEERGANQLSLFDKDDMKSNEYYKIIDDIKLKYGAVSLLKASSLLEESTIRNRENFKNVI